MTDFIATPQPLPVTERHKSFPYQRFFSKLERVNVSDIGKEKGCWEWTSARHPRTDYGVFWMDGRSWQAHRVAWEFKYGPIPDGLILLHRCDNPPCARVDPNGLPEDDHFYLGTVKENNTDRDIKGRGVKLIGDTNPNVKLNADDIRLIRELAKSKSYAAIAKTYQISPVTVSRIVRRETWAHID